MTDELDAEGSCKFCRTRIRMTVGSQVIVFTAHTPDFCRRVALDHLTMVEKMLRDQAIRVAELKHQVIDVQERMTAYRDELGEDESIRVDARIVERRTTRRAQFEAARQAGMFDAPLVRAFTEADGIPKEPIVDLGSAALKREDDNDG